MEYMRTIFVLTEKGKRMVNNVRLIDANALEEYIADNYGCPAVDILHEIATFPAIAPETLRPVGRWSKFYKSGNKVEDGWVSSCCDMWNNRQSNYCPNCGARMKGESNE